MTLTLGIDTVPVSGSLTLNQLSIYIAGISMAVAFVVSIALMLLHATHLSRPAEQIKYEGSLSYHSRLADSLAE